MINMINCIVIGLLEIYIFIFVIESIKNGIYIYKIIDKISFYWLVLTFLIMILEIFLIINKKQTNELSNYLIKNKQNVWTNNYDVSYILPWKLSKLIYAEYGAYGDKEYILTNNSYHSIFSGLFALLSILSLNNHKYNKYLVFIGVSMGSQLINSILYINNYIIQTNDITSSNYNSVKFPTGFALINRPFMYINIFMTIMPIYVILRHCCN